MAILPEPFHLTPGTPESEAFLWTMDGVCLELTHNHGSEKDDEFKVNNGNVEPYRGFGHIAVMTKDVYGECAQVLLFESLHLAQIALTNNTKNISWRQME